MKGLIVLGLDWFNHWFERVTGIEAMPKDLAEHARRLRERRVP